MASRTVTGSYRLRPSSYKGYWTSGTFRNLFNTSSVDVSGLNSSTGGPRAGWKNAFSNTSGTALGDSSDSTYVSIAPPSGLITNWNSKMKGWNGRYGLFVASGTVPEWDYSITSITCYYRVAGSSSGTTNSNTVYFISIASPGTPDNMLHKWASVDVQSSSISTKTFSSNYGNLSKNTYPDEMSICIASARNNLSSLGWIRCYDVWFDIEYSYVEEEETVHFTCDRGIAVDVDGTDVPTADYTTWRHTKWTLRAVTHPGFLFEGWYLNGSLVSTNTSYTYELYDNDRLYVIAKARCIFVGDTQLSDVDAGLGSVTDVYVGTVKVWGESDNKSQATSSG